VNCDPEAIGIETGSREYFRFLFLNFSILVSKFFFDNNIISSEPSKGGSLEEKIMSKVSEACRAGSLESWKVYEIVDSERVKI